MRYGSESSGSSSVLPFAGGAAAGVAADRAVMALKQARSRANWGLGIAVGITALAAVSSSDLNNDQGLAASTISTAQALTFTALGATGPEVAALRSVVVTQGWLLQKIAYDASLFSFSGAPVQPAAPIQVTAITPTTTTTTSNNNVVILALAVIVVLALVLMD